SARPGPAAAPGARSAGPPRGGRSGGSARSAGLSGGRGRVCRTGPIDIPRRTSTGGAGSPRRHPSSVVSEGDAVESEGFDVGRASAVSVLPPARPRKLAKVPFVELADGRLQGVVSSGSDIARVYVSSFTAATRTFSCGTNNNRPCGGLGGFPCKHLQALLTEA